MMMDLLRFELGDRKTARQRQRNWKRFALFATGIYASYLVVGFSQESLFNTDFGGEPNRFSFPATLVFGAFIVSSILSYIAMRGSGMDLVPAAPLRSFIMLAASNSTSMGLANAALIHLDFPTQTLLKSIKPLPVLISGILFFRTLYRPRRAVAVGLICTGLITFMSFKKESEKKDGSAWVGVLLAVTSLALDGVTAFLQDLICQGYYGDDRRRLLAPWHLMYFVNLCGACFTFIWISVTGEIGGSVLFMWEHPRALAFSLAFALASSVGQSMVYQIIACYDSLTCSVTTTLRKFLAITVSVFLFRHSLVPVQWLSIVAVFCGIAIEARESHREADRKVISLS